MAREASQLAGREVGLLGDLPGPKLRIDEVEGGVVELAGGLGADADHRRGDRRRRPPAGLLGGAAGGGLRGRRGLPRRRPGAAAGARGDVRRGSLRGRGRRRGRLPPGAEHARDRGARCRPPAAPTSTGSTSRSSRASTCWRCPSSAAPRTWSRSSAASGSRGADIPLIAKIEKPQAAENAEAIIRAALGGIMVARGDLGIEIADRAGAGRPEAAAGAGRAPLAAVDHRDPDARLDGGVAPAHPGRGLRRRRRDLPGNRRRDAVGGDRGRRVSRSRPCG